MTIVIARAAARPRVSLEDERVESIVRRHRGGGETTQPGADDDQIVYSRADGFRITSARANHRRKCNESRPEAYTAHAERAR